MKKEDYKNHLDKIKCTSGFREKMEERLSDAEDGEYADSVSDVETVTKINYHRWAAVAASVVLAAAIGGTSLYLMKNAPFEPSGSTVSDILEKSGNEIPDNSITEAVVAANDTVYMLADEITSDGDMLTISYSTGSGQYDRRIDMNNIFVGDLKKAIKSLSWNTSEAIFPTGSFYIVKDLIITDEGELYNNGTVYKAENQDISALTAAFDDIKKSSELNFLRFMLLSNCDSFSTLEGDVDFMYTSGGGEPDAENKYYAGGTGRMYFNNDNRSEYFTLSSESIDYNSEFIMEEGYWTFLERGEEIANYIPDENIMTDRDGKKISVSSGYFNYGRSYADYEKLQDIVFSYVDNVYFNPENIYDFNSADEGKINSYHLAYKWNESWDMVLDFNVDERGNILFAKIVQLKHGNGEAAELYNFRIGDGFGGEITYDSKDFSFPMCSDEMKYYHKTDY